MLDVVTGDTVLLAVQIESNGGVAAARKVAVLDGTAFRAAETHQRGGAVEQLPIVLQAPAAATVP